MKAIFAMLLAMLLGAGSAGADLSAAPGNALGLGVLREMCDGQHNCLVSPASLTGALAMAAQGAGGDTEAELLSAMGIAGVTELPAPGEALKVANAAFVKDDLPVKDDYMNALKERFGAERFGLDDADRVNAWVDQHTNHLIDHLVDQIDPSVRLMLVNAVAMDARWAHPFEPSATYAEDFQTPEGAVQADFMHNTFDMPYGESELGQYVRLDYQDGGLYMLLFLPREGKLLEAVQALAADCAGCFKGMEEQPVMLSLPKMDLSAGASLAEPLKTLGVKSAFEQGADFTGISDEPLQLSDVLQKVRVQVDEEGTRAAAVTAMIMGNGFIMNPAKMNLNRPFLFLIADEATGAIAFAGAVCDPTQK
jgi:serpin B